MYHVVHALTTPEPHSLRHGFADAADVSVRDPAEIVRNDPVVTLGDQHRNRRKMREPAERISAVMGKSVSPENGRQ